MNNLVSYSEVRANLAKLWDKIVEDRDFIVLQRRGQEDIAMLPADELSSLLESIHLLRSPASAKRLMSSIQKAKDNQGTVETIDQLKDSLLSQND